MINYYHILGLDQTASNEDIKRAYKTLALAYHPDKNKGSKVAEEKFKRINEAYQVLSDPNKKSRYDIELNYQKRASELYRQATTVKRQEKSVYDRYGKFDWRKAPRYSTAKRYKIDKNYYRNVGISFVAMILFSLAAVGIANYNGYLDEQEELKKEASINLSLTKSQDLYNAQKYKKALLSVENLLKSDPLEYRYFKLKESFINDLNLKSLEKYEQKNYKAALALFEILVEFQKPVRLSNWQIMADCYTALEQHKKAAAMYEVILERDSENLSLMLKVAEIYQNLNDSSKALDYYNEARYLFKNYQEAAYGPAYEFVIDPDELPEAYFKMFCVRAKLLMQNGEFDEAIKDYNWAVFIQPENGELYYLRAQAKLGLNQNDRACNDIKRAIENGFSKNNVKIDLNCPYL